MTPDEAEALVRSFWDEVTRGNLAVLDKFVAEDVVDHNPFPGQGPGVQGLKEVVQTYHHAFPDAQVEILDFTAEGDRFAFRTEMRATHKGEFMGIPATGKAVCVSGIEMIRMSGGKMVERWGMSNNFGMMQQLGLVPEMGGATGAPHEAYRPAGELANLPHTVTGSRGKESAPNYTNRMGSEPVSFARDFDEAWNSHDREKILGFFSDDALLRFVMDPMNEGNEKFPPDQTFCGKAQIQEFMEQHLPGFHVESRGHEQAGDKLVWTSAVSNDFFRKAGLERMDCMSECLIENGKVKSFTVTPSPQSSARLKAAFAPKA